ncbi:hypothetical protein EDB19DRAFT_1913526 [Suillus lakei]|nr:hypothetical protein EDB19DRAFT_1913526 [Suillus lakei]
MSPVYPSLKAISQMTRPYPSTPCPSSQTPHTGPRYFLPDVLPDDDSMEQPFTSCPTLPPPQPHPQTHLPPFTMKLETTATKAKDSDLSNSIHTPGNSMVDHTMEAPPSPPPPLYALRPQKKMSFSCTLH